MSAKRTASTREKKSPRQKQQQGQTSLRLNPITARTDSQKHFLKNFDKHTLSSLEGCPGTGKTFLAMFAALNAVQKQSETYRKVIVIRSTVAVREVGFLPGDVREKTAVYEAPYVGIATELYGRGDAYQVLKQKGMIEFVPTSFLRGITLSNCILVIDEAQNMSFQELHTIITRMGEDCKVVMCGDIYQDDLTSERYNQTSGYSDILDILARVPNTLRIEFKAEDIVRSGFVKDYIMARMEPVKAPIAANWQPNEPVMPTTVAPANWFQSTKEFLVG